jgi:hypothetical protein
MTRSHSGNGRSHHQAATRSRIASMAETVPSSHMSIYSRSQPWTEQLVWWMTSVQNKGSPCPSLLAPRAHSSLGSMPNAGMQQPLTACIKSAFPDSILSFSHSHRPLMKFSDKGPKRSWQSPVGLRYYTVRAGQTVPVGRARRTFSILKWRCLCDDQRVP